MPPAKKSAKKTRAAPTTPVSRVSAVRHRDRRANIPPEELRDFVAYDKKAPKTTPAVPTFCNWV
jgi:hypothetical protein